MLTKEADYALRVILHLAQAGPDAGRVSTAVLADELDIPYRFLRKIMRRLVDAGLVASQRGKSGGVHLTRPSRKLTLLDVLRAVDPRGIRLSDCTLGRSRCSRSRRCAVRPGLCRVQSVLEERLGGVTFAELARPPRRSR